MTPQRGGSAGGVDDALWSAIGDPTRRLIVDLLLAGNGGTATSLSEQLPVSRQGVAKHLGVLDRAGLLHATPAGRERRYGVEGATTRDVYDALTTIDGLAGWWTQEVSGDSVGHRAMAGRRRAPGVGGHNQSVSA
ncbi:ArsR/SmtB family transcription factor [Gordonia aichiensis]|uniref:Putative transcriptional regulator n=1 Tax=Gordonia aichiensis NBRC 108223 TaxID=1220583 RepID=L7KFK0_9ACTN|nr:winged helix-turn-helix domain-containing protein [Gordonia aichiensis]GAC47389.1 putative transcriptional regulator [Gordonia aichiensis NBRC 108223]